MTLARAAPLALLLALPGAACQGRLAHVFGAYAYDPGGKCLDAPAAIDVVAGPAPPKPCLVLRCWLGPDGVAYVTDAACDAPADYRDQTETGSGPCVMALAAYAEPKHEPCPSDAGAGDAGGAGGAGGAGP